MVIRSLWTKGGTVMKITNVVAALGVLARLPLLTIGQEKQALDKKETSAASSNDANSESGVSTRETSRTNRACE
jgi:hypothetical protein